MPHFHNHDSIIVFILQSMQYIVHAQVTNLLVDFYYLFQQKKHKEDKTEIPKSMLLIGILLCRQDRTGSFNLLSPKVRAFIPVPNQFDLGRLYKEG